ncbi:MAG: hypothetical protein ACK587_16535 [Cyanobacteriota bacterium]
MTLLESREGKAFPAAVGRTVNVSTPARPGPMRAREGGASQPSLRDLRTGALHAPHRGPRERAAHFKGQWEEGGVAFRAKGSAGTILLNPVLAAGRGGGGRRARGRSAGPHPDGAPAAVGP